MRAEFLSGFRLIDGAGREIRLPVRKARALFVYLALETKRLHSREELACLLWDAAGDRAARQSLRKCLSDLRRALGGLADRILMLSGDRIGLRPGTVDVDVLAFRRCVADGELAGAVDLLTNGVLLEGLETDSEPFSEWLHAERERHRDMAFEVLHTYAGRLGADGDLDGAIKASRRALEFDPFCEEGHRLLTSLLYRAGRPVAARKHDTRYSALLREELGVVPAFGVAALTDASHPEIFVRGASAKPTVSVRRLTCFGETGTQQRFADCLPLDLTTELSRHRWLSIELDGEQSRYDVDGTVRFVSARCRVTVRLSSEGVALWCENFDGQSGDILETQTQLARTAAGRLVTEIERNEHRRSLSVGGDDTATDWWHRGNRMLQLYSKEGSRAAKRFFARAIACNPEFAPGYASMAQAEQFEAFFGYGDSREASLARGLDLARKAVAIDPVDGFAHLTLGRVLTRAHDFDGAAVALETALALCPSMEVAHYVLGLSLYYQGRQAEALEAFDRALAMNPNSPRAWSMRHMRARCGYDLGNFDDALRWADRAVNAPHAKSVAIALRAAAAERAGYSQLARQTVRELRRRDPDITAGYIFRTFGNAYIAAPVHDMVDHLRRAGLPD